MERKPLAVFDLNGQYDSSRPLSAVNPSRLAPGTENVVWRGGRLEAFKGLGNLAGSGSRFMCNASDSYAGLGGFSDSTVKGSVLKILNGLFAIGNGEVYYEGASLSFNAASTLQLKLLQSGGWSATTYQAGLSQPSAPTLAARDSIGAGLTGKNKAGSYSVKAFLVRDATGAKSIASEMSNVVIIPENTGNTGKTMRITFPLIGASGADYWGVGVSPRNFGTTGGHFVYFKIAESALTTIDGVARSYEIEWSDGDLVGKDLVPIASYPPPAAMFAGVLGDCLFVDGAVGDTVTGVSASQPGSTIAQSLPLFVEEFPPDWRMYPTEAPTALIRGGDDFYYRFGRNSMGVIAYVGGSPPLHFQLIWSNVGVSYPHNAAVGAGGMLFARTGQRGLVRIGAGGQPESAWANNIAAEIADVPDEDLVLGWDENSQTLCVMHDALIYPYNINNGWGAPCDVSDKVTGRIVACVTHLGSLYIAAEQSATIDLFEYDAGTGSLMKVRTDWHYAGESEYLRQIDVLGRGLENEVTVDLYINEENTPFRTWTVSPHRATRLRPVKLGKKADSFQIGLTHESEGGEMFERVTVSGVDSYITR